jgi:hypothetical protein
MFPSAAARTNVVCATLVLSALLVAAFPALSARADSNGLELSNDGVTFGPTLTAPLFASMPTLVPAESATASFVVRNSSPVAAYLSVVLGSRGWDSWDYASSLSLGASSPGGTPGTATVTSSDKCAVLLHGRLLQPGETAVVSTTITLGDLSGSSGQHATAWMQFTVKLTQSASTRTPRACSTGGSSVVVVPEARAADESDETPGTVTPTPFPTADPAEGLPPFANTAFGWDGRFAIGSLIAMPLGAVLFLILARRRSRSDDELVTQSADSIDGAAAENPFSPERQLEDTP